MVTSCYPHVTSCYARVTLCYARKEWYINYLHCINNKYFLFLPSQSSSLLTSLHSLSMTFLFACCLSHKGALSNTLLISNSTSIIKTATSYSRESVGKNGLGESFSWLTLAAYADKFKQVPAVRTYIQLHCDIIVAGWRLLALVSRARKPAFVVRAALHKSYLYFIVSR